MHEIWFTPFDSVTYAEAPFYVDWYDAPSHLVALRSVGATGDIVVLDNDPRLSLVRF